MVSLPVFQLPSLPERYKELKESFVGKYGATPDYFARAPGRVNLIGEHIDYCGYAVLPMAIEQDIVVAVKKTDTKLLRLSNFNSQYQDFECDLSNFEIDCSKPTWYNYFLCGIKAILEHSPSLDVYGVDCIVHGTVPPSSGLSSSSALVCCAALGYLHASGTSISKEVMAEICAKCERYVGTQGGGMDQAISFLAERGTAKLIEFNPVRATDVNLPAGAVFVVSNSCVDMNKAATAHFNIRVVECRIATQILAKTKGLKWRDFKRLGDVQQALGIGLDDAVSLVNEVLHSKPYSKEEVCDVLTVTPDELATISLSPNTLDVTEFKLHDRASHVFGEANRVWRFKKTCDDNAAHALESLGQLMTKSHESCRDLYQCSCDDLDDLVNICMNSGAIGSRLTGAGWGGCAVSLVSAAAVPSFIEQVAVKYYKQNKRRNEKLKESLFSTQPGGGACIYKHC